MGDQKDHQGVAAEIACRLVSLGAWFVLWTFKSLLVFGGPALVVSLIILSFMKNPTGGWNGLAIALYFTVASGWILAWLWLIVRPLVRDILIVTGSLRRRSPGPRSACSCGTASRTR